MKVSLLLSEEGMGAVEEEEKDGGREIHLPRMILVILE